MSEHNLVGQTDSPELLTEWQGEVIYDPGVLFEEKQAEAFPAELAATELAGWIAQVALSEAIGNAVYAAIRAKVVGVLSGYRRRFGAAKLEEVKQLLLRDLQKYRANRKITDERLRERIDVLFAEAQE